MKKLKRITALLLVMLMCAGLVACGNDSGSNASVTPNVTPGADDSVIDLGVWDELNADEIVASMGAGWNCGNQLEANTGGTPSEIAWNSNVITPNLIKAVADAGFKSVRVPVSYLSKIDDANGYKIDEAWLDRVREVVDYCIAEDLYVIINIHGDGYESVTGGWLHPGADNQEYILEKFAAVWKQIAEKFKDYDERVIFESMNEMGAERSCTKELYDDINAYNKVFVDTVRQTGGNNDKRWVLIPGYNTNIDLTAENENFVIPEDTYLSESVPAGENRIMVSVHYYDPWSFCGGETDDATQWGVDADPTKTANWGNESVLEGQFKKLYDKFTSQGYPVIVGEYGAIDKSMVDEENTYFRAYFCKKVCEASKKYGCVPVYWDNGYNGKYGFGLFNRKVADCPQTQPEIINAIIGVYNEEASVNGSATSIELSHTELSMEAGDSAITIVATTDTGEAVNWESDNSLVATVSKEGVVYPQKAGTCKIIATCGTAKAECTVTVSEATATSVKLYILETKGWQTCASEESVSLKKPGEYTLTLDVSKENLERIGSFYIKDCQLQDGVISSSLAKSATVVINSVTINGTELTLQGAYQNVQMVNGNGHLDFCLLNEWATGTELFAEYAMNGSDYMISGVELLDVNEVSVTFTIVGITY